MSARSRLWARALRASRSWRRSALACALLAAAARAGAVDLHVILVNNARDGFDYSLQMANANGNDLRNRTFLGKETSREITDNPILMPGQAADSVHYLSTEPGDGADDAISMNLRVYYHDDGGPGSRSFHMDRGMMNKIFDRPHTCDLRAGGPVHDGETIVLAFSESMWTPYMLNEILPNGDSCTFYISRGFGPTLWERDSLAAPAAAAAWEPGADRPGVNRAMRADELALYEPGLLERLDAEYQRVTGIDLREVRARNAALRGPERPKTP